MSADSPDPRFRGMTTNERLLAVGLHEKFGDAARKRDRAAMTEILSQVDLASQADTIINAILANPSKYGF
jgi:hypothetical protein